MIFFGERVGQTLTVVSVLYSITKYEQISKNCTWPQKNQKQNTQFPREQALNMLFAMNMLDDMLITNYPTNFGHSSF